MTKANHQLSQRLVNVEQGLKRAEPGFIRRSNSTLAYQLQKELVICEENQRLVRNLSVAQPAIVTARELKEDFRHSRFFQDLRRKPLLTVNTGRSGTQSRVPLSFRTASSSTEKTVHSAHILLPFGSLQGLSSGEPLSKVDTGADGS